MEKSNHRSPAMLSGTAAGSVMGKS